MDKHQRYRTKLKDGSLCAHCGKDAFPFTTCSDRRAYKRRWYAAHSNPQVRKNHGVHKPMCFNSVIHDLEDDEGGAEFHREVVMLAMLLEEESRETGQPYDQDAMNKFLSPEKSK